MFIEKENNLNETGSQAEKICRKSLAAAGYAFGEPVSFHWSQLTNPRGEKAAAMTAYEVLLDQEPCNKSALEGLAYLNQLMGHSDKAQYFRRKLKEVEAKEYGICEAEQENVVDYLLAKTGEAPMPHRVPANFVVTHFNKYAKQFDASLLDDLQYIGPKLIHQQVASFFPVADKSLQILDLGCGTGLIGEAIVPYAEAMTGVDLSGEMLEIAAKRCCYDQLINDDCLNFLENNHNSYNLITASDVLIYLGEITSLFSLIHNSLRKNGIFMFTLECTEVANYKLSNTGRFKHKPSYIQLLARQNNYQVLYEQPVALRKERGETVDAMLFCLQA